MEKISGYVDHFLFQTEDGYKVIVLISDGEESVCVGNCPGLTPGVNIEALGEYVEHPAYGHQFKMSQYTVIMPSTKEDIERYLASGAVKGVGAALASRIVKKFGADTLRIIEEEPERLAEIKGISERKAMEIAEAMEDKKEMREAILFLSRYGISNSLAVKIYNQYGPEVYTIMRENPYRLAEDITGVGFRTADEIAMQAGIRTDSTYRTRCGVIYALLQAVGEGHCYLPREELLARSSSLLGTSVELIETEINNMAMDRKIIIREDKVYSPNYFYGELNCARMLFDLNIPYEESSYLPSQEKALIARLEKLAKASEMELEELQLQAVLECIRNGVFVLSGGPGTGKTTTINLIIQYFADQNLDILLAAPTGRAAKRMSEATGYEAKTIHRLLELNGALSDEDRRKVTFERNETNPLDADVVIIDEMSMVDLHLFQALLKAIVPGTRLVLVGDMDQLPSIGPGQILRDLIQSRCFPTVVLSKIFRQNMDSDIIVNAHKINHGEEIDLSTGKKDFFFLERNDINVIYKHMIELIRDKLPKFVGATPFDIQVLTPMRKGSLGTATLNPILQKYLNPPDPSKAEYATVATLFREGDKVMQMKNNYDLEWEIVGKYNIPIDKGMGIFNGDMGTVLQIDEKHSQMVVEFDEHRRVTYPFSLLEELELCYAVTIHKAQGSEYPAVVMPLHSGPKMLFNRNLLYTGITRARRCVMILGQKDTVTTMIHNENENQRYTSLQERIREICQ